MARYLRLFLSLLLFSSTLLITPALRAGGIALGIQGGLTVSSRGNESYPYQFANSWVASVSYKPKDWIYIGFRASYGGADRAWLAELQPISLGITKTVDNFWISIGGNFGFYFQGGGGYPDLITLAGGPQFGMGWTNEYLQVGPEGHCSFMPLEEIWQGKNDRIARCSVGIVFRRVFDFSGTVDGSSGE